MSKVGEGKRFFVITEQPKSKRPVDYKFQQRLKTIQEECGEDIHSSYKSVEETPVSMENVEPREESSESTTSHFLFT